MSLINYHELAARHWRSVALSTCFVLFESRRLANASRAICVIRKILMNLPACFDASF